jgi:hypothetical protein
LNAEVSRLDDIRADLRGYVDQAPRVRFTPAGEAVWEFGVSLIDTLALHNEVVVRMPDRHEEQLQRWVVPGRRVNARGTLHVARWQSSSGREHVRLLLEATEVVPLDERVPGSAAVVEYSERRMPMRDGHPAQDTHRACRSPACSSSDRVVNGKAVPVSTSIPTAQRAVVPLPNSLVATGSTLRVLDAAADPDIGDVGVHTPGRTIGGSSRAAATTPLSAGPPSRGPARGGDAGHAAKRPAACSISVQATPALKREEDG